MTGGSVIFDRAADYYDQTRTLPAETMRAQTAQLAGLIADAGGPVLEIGVGTGRIAIPLAEAGLQVLGVDLSDRMLAVLAGKRSAVAMARASATTLPLRDHSVGAVLACHVLHLIEDWRQAVGEVFRVLRPGGLLLAARGRAAGTAAELHRQFRLAAGFADRPAGLDLDELDRYLRDRGVTPRHLPPIPNPSSWTAAYYLQRIRDNTYSWTWSIPEATRLEAVQTVAAWVTRTLGDPAEVRLPADPVRWRSYRLP